MRSGSSPTSPACSSLPLQAIGLGHRRQVRPLLPALGRHRRDRRRHPAGHRRRRRRDRPARLRLDAVDDLVGRRRHRDDPKPCRRRRVMRDAERVHTRLARRVGGAHRCRRRRRVPRGRRLRGALAPRAAGARARTSSSTRSSACSSCGVILDTRSVASSSPRWWLHGVFGDGLLDVAAAAARESTQGSLRTADWAPLSATWRAAPAGWLLVLVLPLVFPDGRRTRSDPGCDARRASAIARRPSAPSRRLHCLSPTSNDLRLDDMDNPVGLPSSLAWVADLLSLVGVCWPPCSRSCWPS